MNFFQAMLLNLRWALFGGYPVLPKIEPFVLPTPEELKAFHEVNPSCPNKILSLLEVEQKYNHLLLKNRLEFSFKIARIGIFINCIRNLLILLLAVDLIVNGYATIVIAAVIFFLAFVFFKRKT